MHDTRLTKIVCRYDRSPVPDVVEAIRAEFCKNETLIASMPTGARIAVAVGSRGIANLPVIVGTVVRELQRRGAKPFIVPAMGSHGGATAQGQASILHGYGIDEESVGAPVVSSMDTVELPFVEGCVRDGDERDGSMRDDSRGGRRDDGRDGDRVFMSKDAFESDGVVLVNRIKVHTDFHGEYESGLVKMSVIGLGKHRQALEIHGAGVSGLRERIVPAARRVFGTGKILCGLGIVENAYDETALVRLIPAGEILDRERDLLVLSRKLMPRIPVDRLDVLLVDEMGKDISGVGMDPNIIGRIRVRGQAEPELPRISSIAVFGLTAASHGNALGIGLADVTTRAVTDRIDFAATMENAVTSAFLDRAKIPLAAENPRRAVEIALRAASVPDRFPDNDQKNNPGDDTDNDSDNDPDNFRFNPSVRMIRIRNTLKIHEMYVSDALLKELGSNPDVEITSVKVPLFEGEGLYPCFAMEPG